ncbi:MAG: bifunctional folylpolyglutamate synthase/dihydrofolate synthase [Nitrospira sp.]|nr:bifunctional folylpolyglutamate synthase/dihydrofolate synthase [Nitrospira sp.]
MKRSYEAARERLYALQQFGIHLGLETISSLLSELGNPQERFPVLHVAGTNGKGSVAAIAASVLQAAGIRVGLYTSPHLLDFRERIQVRGTCIPENRVVELFDRIQTLPSFAVPPTFFEVATAMAFQYFAEERVDIAVMEVGLGGRFDATNVCRSIGTVVTNVSFDHEKYLGSSLEAIAFEKAGILKRNVPLVMGPVESSVDGVVREQARQKQVRTFTFGSEFLSVSHPSGAFDFIGMRHNYVNLRCALKGEHQTINAACALAVLEDGVMPLTSIPERAVRQGLEQVSWPGRLERLRRHPLTLCDGAHNPAAAECLKIFLQRNVSEQPERRLILVVGMMQDKNLSAFLHTVAPLAAVVILTQIHSPRAAAVHALKEALPVMDRPVYERDAPEAAMDLAACLAREHDLICVTGSLFLVGHVKSLMTGNAYEPVLG